MLKTWQLGTLGSNPSEWSNMMLWPIYKRSSELSPIPSGAPWNPAKVQQHLAPCASPHIPLLPCCTNPGALPPSHFLYHLGTTYLDQNSLGECFSDLAHKSPELQEEFLYNAETQVELRRIFLINFPDISVTTQETWIIRCIFGVWFVFLVPPPPWCKAKS